MTTHEFAKYLLSKEDLPLYSQDYYEVQGEMSVGYSPLKGVLENVVENGYILETDYLQGSPNDKYYRKGDFFVEGFDEVFTEDDFEYMVDHKGNKYVNYPTGNVGFFEVDTYGFAPDKILPHKVKMVLEDGWHPKMKEMSLEEAKVWYKENSDD